MVRTNLSLFDNFNQLTPYAVGFDRVFDQLQNYVENNSTSTGHTHLTILEKMVSIIMILKWHLQASVKKILKLKLQMVY